MAGFHARQMRRQRRALGYLSGAAHGRRLQRFKLGFHRCDVGFDGVVEQAHCSGFIASERAANCTRRRRAISAVSASILVCL
jgi:hypothetical protein